MWIEGDEDEDHKDDVANVGDDNLDSDDELDAGDDDLGEPSDKEEKPLTIRESLKKAFTEQVEADKNEDKDSKENKKPEARKREAITSDKGDKPEKDVKADINTLNPPTSWSKEAKASWANLDAHTKNAIAKREKEISDGYATLTQERARIKELDDVLQPRREAIKNFGASEAQVINNLFLWMEGLTGPHKEQVFKQLGQNFKVDLSKLVEQPQNTNQNTDTNTDINNGDLPANIQSLIDNAVANRVKPFEDKAQADAERVAAESRQAAADFVNNWAKDKTHFQAVRGTMFALLQGGTIPLKNGAHDLDAAYEAAIYATPAVRELYNQEQKEAAEAKVAEEKAKMERVRLAKLKKAQGANVSVKSSASFTPGRNNASSRQKANGSAGPVSVRDSIKAAMGNTNT